MDMTLKTAEGYFNWRVAGVMIHDSKLLVMGNNEYNSFYLPGGRVHMNESSEDAIKREIKEELHFDVKSYRPLWFHECFFIEDLLKEKFHELCMYYFIDIASTDFRIFDSSFELREGNRVNQFYWIPFDELTEKTVYPLFIKDEIFNLPDHLTVRADYEYSTNQEGKAMNELWDIYDGDRQFTGRTILRSDFFNRKYEDYPNEYHIAVHIWIRNSDGEWLISKRTPNKNYPLLWECTGGSVLAGESSLDGALREVKEELGISLNRSNGDLYKSIKRDVYNDFCDVWLFEHNCSINEIILQEDETSDAMWASSAKIRKMIEEGEFIPLDNMQYVYELLDMNY